MKHYSHYGFNEFLIALGNGGDLIKRYFLGYSALNASLTMTGGRVRRLEPWLKGETFMMTYGDGVSNLDLKELQRFHRAHGRLATVTAVRPASRFGGIIFQGDLVTQFDEKPRIGAGWVNGGRGRDQLRSRRLRSPRGRWAAGSVSA